LREAESARRIVEDELHAARVGSRAAVTDVGPVIRALRAHAHEIAQAEVARILPKLGPLGEIVKSNSS
jgi:glutamyl-tRNA reductase